MASDDGLAGVVSAPLVVIRACFSQTILAIDPT